MKEELTLRRLRKVSTYGGTFATLRTKHPVLTETSSGWDFIVGGGRFPELDKLRDHASDCGAYVSSFSDPIHELLEELDP